MGSVRIAPIRNSILRLISMIKERFWHSSIWILFRATTKIWR
jgi:hypothetical protein